MTDMIHIVNYGMGNIGSLINMFKYIGISVEVTSNPKELSLAKKILLPGVGAFGPAMDCLDKLNLRNVLIEKAFDQKSHMLGICLGMQLLTTNSEEGDVNGLDIIQGHTRRFPEIKGFKVPHMGWNKITVDQPSELTKNLQNEPKFYFVHSYYVEVANAQHRSLSCNYGIRFDAGVKRGNVYGVQFHPEKSHKYGLHLLKQFANIPC